LWLLIGLQYRGWLRHVKRGAGTVRGVLVLAFSTLLFVFWLVSLFFNTASSRPQDPELAERIAPLGLLAICIMNVLFSTGERVITFQPAEVDFLFPGPFTRRQLLTYKLVGLLAVALFQSLIFFLLTRNVSGSLLSGLVGVFMIVVFFQFFTLALTLTATTIGARAYGWGRKIVLIVVVLAVALVAAQSWRGVSGDDPIAVLAQMEQSTVWRAVRTPLLWFTKTFRAEHVWPDLVQYGSLALLVDVALLAIIFALDAQYLEASAAASERRYQLMQQRRSMQDVLAAGPSRSGKARFTLPSLPWLGGVGPILWRQLVTVSRSYMPLFVLLGMLGATIAPLFGRASDLPDPSLEMLQLGMLLGLTIFLTPTVLCDFRSDVDRIDVLKTLPIGPIWIVVGQLLAPTLLLCFLQMIVVAVLLAVLGRVEPLLLAVPLLGLPINFVLFAIENVLFLFFPVRMMATTPGDMQTSGRYMLIFVAKYICLLPIVLAAFLAGLLAWFISQSVGIMLAAAAMVVAAAGVSLVPVAVLAFRRFDVSRDTPA
jgi:hypothetical protein